MSTGADDEMAVSEHLEEFSQRTVFCIVIVILATLTCFADVREIVKVFQAPAIGVKFLQFAPGEYFFASFKIACYFFLGRCKVPKKIRNAKKTLAVQKKIAKNKKNNNK